MKRFFSRAFTVFSAAVLVISASACKTTGEIKSESDVDIERQLQKDLEQLEKADSGKKLSLDYNTEKISQKNEYIDADISYPHFNDMIHLDDLNVIIENNVISYYEDFKNFAKANALNAPFEYKLDFKVTFSKKIISVYTELYNYCGDDHGNTVIITYNYDAEAKEFIDVITVSKKTFSEISEICNASLKDQLIYSKEGMSVDEEELIVDFIDGATTATGANFNIFTVDNNHITIYFEPNVAAPFSYGIQKVEFNIK